MVEERTVVILKPDSVNRKLIGEIIGRFEKKGLKISGMKLEHLKEEKLREHYAHHANKQFFEALIKYMSSIPSILIVLEGKEAVKVVRKMVGDTFGREAEPGTIRGDLSMSSQQNIIHASGSVEEAEKEIKRFFSSKELYRYELVDFDWIYAEEEQK